MREIAARCEWGKKRECGGRRGRLQECRAGNAHPGMESTTSGRSAATLQTQRSADRPREPRLLGKGARICPLLGAKEPGLTGEHMCGTSRLAASNGWDSRCWLELAALMVARKATDRLDDQMTQARHAREKACVLRGFPDGRPDDDAASWEAPHTLPLSAELRHATSGGRSDRACRTRVFARRPTTCRS
jgi:hypothetical protein